MCASGLTQREIGDLTGMDYSTVSVVRKRFRLMTDQDHALKELVVKVKNRYRDT